MEPFWLLARRLVFPDGTPLHGVTVATGSSSCILVWRVADYSKAIVIPCQTMQIGVGMYFLSGTNKVLSGTSDGRVCVWGLDKLQ